MEPTSTENVAQWIQTAQRQRDPFEHVRVASHEHRESHGAGCSVYPTSSGPLLSVLAAAVAAERILGGLLLSANLFLAQFVPDLTAIDQMAEYRSGFSKMAGC